MNIGDILGIISDGISSLKNTRFAYVFQGEDFAARDEKEKERQKEREKERENKNEFDSPAIYLDDETVQTPSEKFLENIRKKPLGGLISRAINVIFSPSFALCISVVGAAVLFSSPLGLAVGAIGFGISAAAIGIDTLSNVYRYQKLNKIREERVLLDEITEIKKQILELRNLNPDLFDKLNTLQPVEPTALEEIKKNPLKILKSTIISSTPTTTFSLVTSIMTLNPTALAFSILSTISGYASSTRLAYEYKKKNAELRNHNNELKAELGIEIPKKNGTNNQMLADTLNDLRSYHKALQSTMALKQTNTTPEDFHNALMVEKSLGVRPYVHKQSVWADFKKLFFKGFSWSEHNRLNTPSMIEREVKINHGPERYERERAGRIAILQKRIERSVENQLSKANQHNVVQEDSKTQYGKRQRDNTDLTNEQQPSNKRVIEHTSLDPEDLKSTNRGSGITGRL